MRVLFLGTPEFAVPSLQKLIESRYEVCAVVTQPDRPSGRGRRVQAPPVKVRAGKAGIPVLQPVKVRDSANRDILASYEPDFLVVVAYGQILPRWLLELPRTAPVNVHGSLLPKYRGAAPVAWAILNGDRSTGVTTMLMDEHLDTGAMLLKKEVPIGETATAGELADVLAREGSELLLPTLDGLADGSLQPAPQDESAATLAPRLTKEMSPIDWSRNARDLHNQVRGLNPWPLASTLFQGRRLQLFRTLPEDGWDPAAGSAAEGGFLGFAGEAMRVRCGDASVLKVLEVQLEGKARVSGRAFANGARLRPGERPFSSP